MLSVGLVLAETYRKPSRLGGFGSIDCPTRYGTCMFVHFVEAPETRVRAEGRYKDFRLVLGLQYIKLVLLFHV